MNSIPSLIFLGDTHGFIKDFLKQKEIILRFKPKFVLCENLEDLSLESEKDYQTILKKKKISDMTSVKEVKELIEFCYRLKIKLIGIDFKNFGFHKNLRLKIKNQEKLSKKEERELEKIITKREERHIRIIKKYLKKTEDIPLIVIIGTWHLRDGSNLMKTFKNCRIIFPCDKKGDLLIKPKGNKEVFYREKIK